MSDIETKSKPYTSLKMLLGALILSWVTLACCPPPQIIRPDSQLLIPAQKNKLTAENTFRDLAIENDFRGKEIDKVNLNLNVIRDK